MTRGICRIGEQREIWSVQKLMPVCLHEQLVRLLPVAVSRCVTRVVQERLVGDLMHGISAWELRPAVTLLRMR